MNTKTHAETQRRKLWTNVVACLESVAAIEAHVHKHNDLLAVSFALAHVRKTDISATSLHPHSTKQNVEIIVLGVLGLTGLR